ncbi:hypothetical protein [Paludifilum halophilum]|uniref:Glycerophosphoryl diester phosphodiesterase membrane domain-containing protein n=1 Tax=Paludifilum halophilum TaxID=1642702 RepID=A0A235B1M3_9BACL|nr:hypothetical protein [Paludifilum halophilum]OYD06142.1 hypothetical protein CHM34_17970 [Paludifilum halophilum]
MTELKEALRYYKEHILRILLIGFTIVLPVQFVLIVAANYFYLTYGLMDLLFLADLINGIFTLMAVSLISVPYIQMAKSSFLDEGVTVGKIFDSLMRYMFPVYVISILYAFGVAFGMFLFIIPGILFAVWFYAFPYAAVLEDETWFKGLKRAWEFGKSHFASLFLLLVISGLIEWLIRMISMLTTNLLTESYLIIVLVNTLTSILYLPVIYFIVTIKYLNWIGAGDNVWD